MRLLTVNTTQIYTEQINMVFLHSKESLLSLCDPATI